MGCVLIKGVCGRLVWGAWFVDSLWVLGLVWVFSCCLGSLASSDLCCLTCVVFLDFAFVVACYLFVLVLHGVVFINSVVLSVVYIVVYCLVVSFVCLLC